MVNLIDRTTQQTRQRLSSILVAPVPEPVDDVLRYLSQRWPSADLAQPPADSGLKPVCGDYGPPLVGHLLDYIRFGTDFGRERYDRYGPVTWMGAFGSRMVMVAGPDATQAVLTDKTGTYSQGGWSFLIDHFFHRGLMLLDFDEHRVHRHIMQHAFTRSRLAGYSLQVGPRVRASVPGWPADRPVRLYWLLKRLTLDVATQVFMGGRGGDVDTERINRAFVATVRAASSLVRYPLPGTRWRAGINGRKVLEDYFASHLPAARAESGDDLFSALCHAETDEGVRFSDDDVINHMIFLMMAAHDTATITTTAAAYFLAKHPEWQERARAESLALGTEPPDINGLGKLGVLDLVITESLRLLAPVPLVMRKTTQDTDLLGHYLPADTLLAVAPAVDHYVPDYWTDPDVFDPERFASHRREDESHRFAWVPFGGGAHKCIGMIFGTLEVKAILHEMLLNYRWQVPDDYRVRWDNTSLPVPSDGLPLQLIRY